MITEALHTENIKPLFENWNESCIWSCLQKVMGRIYTDDPHNPTAAMCILGDFSFFAGKPNKELAAFKPEWCKQDFIIMVPQNESWAQLIEECYGGKAKKVTRYAIKKEPGIFNREKLEKAASSLPAEYSMKLIDEELYHLCKKDAEGFLENHTCSQPDGTDPYEWCRDWVAQYPDYDSFRRLGLGVVILKDDCLVSGASSYSSYQGGIEIEIDTKEDYRRRGLAYACGARLILECLDRDLYPSWDAQNKWSVGLAEKLGYHYSHDYVAYEIWGY